MFDLIAFPDLVLVSRDRFKLPQLLWQYSSFWGLPNFISTTFAAKVLNCGNDCSFIASLDIMEICGWCGCNGGCVETPEILTLQMGTFFKTLVAVAFSLVSSKEVKRLQIMVMLCWLVFMLDILWTPNILGPSCILQFFYFCFPNIYIIRDENIAVIRYKLYRFILCTWLMVVLKHWF